MGYPPRPELPDLHRRALARTCCGWPARSRDGVMLWLCNPHYIRETVVPEVTEGRERAGKTMDGFDVVAAVPVGVTDDPEAARDAFRKDLIPYASLPFYRAMLERSGFDADLAAFDEGMAGGDDRDRRWPGSRTSCSPRSRASATADDARAKVVEYRDAGATSPCIGGIPGAGFDAALEAVAEITEGSLAQA